MISWLIKIYRKMNYTYIYLWPYKDFYAYKTLLCTCDYEVAPYCHLIRADIAHVILYIIAKILERVTPINYYFSSSEISLYVRSRAQNSILEKIELVFFSALIFIVTKEMKHANGRFDIFLFLLSLQDLRNKLRQIEPWLYYEWILKTLTPQYFTIISRYGMIYSHFMIRSICDNFAPCEARLFVQLSYSASLWGIFKYWDNKALENKLKNVYRTGLHVIFRLRIILFNNFQTEQILYNYWLRWGNVFDIPRRFWPNRVELIESGIVRKCI